jgi:hypothetical protein
VFARFAILISVPQLSAILKTRRKNRSCFLRFSKIAAASCDFQKS